MSHSEVSRLLTPDKTGALVSVEVTSGVLTLKLIGDKTYEPLERAVVRVTTRAVLQQLRSALDGAFDEAERDLRF